MQTQSQLKTGSTPITNKVADLTISDQLKVIRIRKWAKRNKRNYPNTLMLLFNEDPEERTRIALQVCDYSIQDTKILLNVSERTIFRRIEEYGIKIPKTKRGVETK